MRLRLRSALAILTCPLALTVLCILSSTSGEDVATMQKTPGGGATATVVPVQQEAPDNSTAPSGESEVTNADGAATPDDGSGGGVAGSPDIKPDDAVQASFEEAPSDGDTSYPPPEYPFVESASQNAGVSSGTTDGVAGVVVTLVDTATAELQQRADLSSQLDPLVQQPEITNRTEKPLDSTPESNVTTLQNDTVPKAEPKENLTEEIPSFSEWAQRQLEEAEKKREEVNSSNHNQSWNGKTANNLKVRSKNYASPDCGAKIIAANPEAVSPSSVLSPSRDEYKLNTCTSRIWFVVELCEAIQAKKIDLANFELFSSSPKDFSVSVSDRFPSREWSNVGHFTAKDERDVQSFDLNPHLFGKYVKVELHSHHGSEHFCPISLFRVYGTSEFEVLEKEDQPTEQEEDDDDEEEDKGQSPKNLFSSATDAVISIVKKAAEVLGNKANNSNQTSVEDSKNVIKYTPLISTCTTPSHIVVCDNCSDVLFGKVYELLSCRSRQINNLLGIRLIARTIYNTPICLAYGLDFQSKRTLETPNIYSSYVKSFFPPRYLAALCNTVAIIESKVVLNISKQLNATSKEEEVVFEAEPTEIIETTENLIDVHTINEAVTDTSFVSQINPTKTLMPDELIEVTNYVSKSDEEVSATQSIQSNHTVEVVEESSGEHEFEPTTESTENLDLDLDFENNTTTTSTPSPPKESVFLRLSNRIKTLERNMSLSSQYLEELSRRYKKQVEEMQRLLEKTIATLNEESKSKDEWNQRLEEKIRVLTETVEMLVNDNNNTFSPFHLFFLILLSIFTILTFCRRAEPKHPAFANSSPEVQRRKSIDVINHTPPVKKERRPSEEALKITGTYEHLLVDEELRKKARAKRKKKKQLARSNSITTLSEESEGYPRTSCSETTINKPWVEIAPQIEEIPFVLEESDHSHLQELPPLPDSPPNGDITTPPAYVLTATESRKLRIPEALTMLTHKKSASVDETTKRQSSPAPSTGTVSVNLPYEEPKKVKKGTFKKIFKKVF